MLGAGGHPQEIAALTEHLQHLPFEMDHKQSPALDEEAHLVLAVGVFGEELLAQGNAIGVIRPQADRIDGGIGATRLHLGDLAGVGRQHRGLIGSGGEFWLHRPALVAQAALGQGLGNHLGVVALEQQGCPWIGAGAVPVEAQAGHGLERGGRRCGEPRKGQLGRLCVGLHRA